MQLISCLLAVDKKKNFQIKRNIILTNQMFAWIPYSAQAFTDFTLEREGEGGEERRKYA